MSKLVDQAQAFFEHMKGKKVRKGNNGFLVFACDGVLGYYGDQTAVAEKAIDDPKSCIAGCYNFNDANFSLKEFVDDCELALKESILIAEGAA